MNTQSRACDPHRIERFLDGGLSDLEQEVLEEHLSECPACREALCAQTAAPEFWDKTSQYLRDDGEIDALSAYGDLAAVRDSSHAIGHVLDALQPTDDPNMLGRLNGHEVSGVIGSGAMGVVLKGFDKSLDRTVAIKVMAPHLASHGAARKRFAREAKAAAAVLHPNVMAIHSVASDESLPYLVMPYFRGASLQKRIDVDGALSVTEVLRIASQIAHGLQAAHTQGLVHRDIKPANILLEDGVERVAITDFGLARAVDDATMTRTGVIAGTPQYMSPEQASGETVGQKSDLFSLGSVMYTMCTGHPPFRAETSYGILRRINDTEPRPIREINPDVPPWLCTIIGKLMAKRPDDRFSSAEEVGELLEDCLAHIQQPTAVPLPKSLAEHVAKVSVRSGFFASTSGYKVAAGIGFVAASLLAVVAIFVTSREHTVDDKHHPASSPSAMSTPDAETRQPGATGNIAGSVRTPRDGSTQPNPPRDTAGSVITPYVGKTPSDDSASGSAGWNDGVAQQLRKLSDAADQLEQRATLLRDETAVPPKLQEVPHFFDDFLALVRLGDVEKAEELIDETRPYRPTPKQLSGFGGIKDLRIVRVYADEDAAIAVTCAFFFQEQSKKHLGYFVLHAHQDEGRWLIDDIDHRMVDGKDNVYAELGRFWERNPRARLLRSEEDKRVPVVTADENPDAKRSRK